MLDVMGIVRMGRIRREDNSIWLVNISKGERLHPLRWVVCDVPVVAELDHLLAGGRIGLDPHDIAWVRS